MTFALVFFYRMEKIVRIRLLCVYILQRIYFENRFTCSVLQFQWNWCFALKHIDECGYWIFFFVRKHAQSLAWSSKNRQNESERDIGEWDETSVSSKNQSLLVHTIKMLNTRSKYGIDVDRLYRNRFHFIVIVIKQTHTQKISSALSAFEGVEEKDRERERER